MMLAPLTCIRTYWYAGRGSPSCIIVDVCVLMNTICGAKANEPEVVVALGPPRITHDLVYLYDRVAISRNTGQIL